jgi:hypothetical protein
MRDRWNTPGGEEDAGWPNKGNGDRESKGVEEHNLRLGVNEDLHEPKVQMNSKLAPFLSVPFAGMRGFLHLTMQVKPTMRN